MNTIKLNSQFIVIITIATINIFNISLSIIKRPCPKISAILSISVTVLVIKIPIEDLS